MDVLRRTGCHNQKGCYIHCSLSKYCSQYRGAALSLVHKTQLQAQASSPGSQSASFQPAPSPLTASQLAFSPLAFNKQCSRHSGRLGPPSTEDPPMSLVSSPTSRGFPSLLPASKRSCLHSLCFWAIRESYIWSSSRSPSKPALFIGSALRPPAWGLQLHSYY